MASSDLKETVLLSLKEAGLFPGSAGKIIPPSFEPSTELKVSFNGKNVAYGNLFRSSECASAPSIAFALEADASADATYLLMLIDPDAPTPDDPKFAFWRHWIVSSLQPSSDESQPISLNQPAVTEYLGPGPKDESKPHRYLFLLFREPSGLSLSKEDIGGDEFVQRRSFYPPKFIAGNQLRLVAVNWMLGAGDGWKEADA